MRASLAALTTVASVLVVGGCASDVGSGIDEARSSAASIGAGVRSSAASIGAGLKRACDASKSQLTPSTTSAASWPTTPAGPRSWPRRSGRPPTSSRPRPATGPS